MTETVTDIVPVEWRPIPGAPGYEASSEGDIRGKRGKVLKPFGRGGKGGQDYLAVDVYDGGKRRIYVHVAVCSAFNGPAPAPGWMVHHKDEDRTANAADNLEWVEPHGHSVWHRRKAWGRDEPAPWEQVA